MVSTDFKLILYIYIKITIMMYNKGTITLLTLGKSVAWRNILKQPLVTLTYTNQREASFQFGRRRRGHNGEATSD